MDEAEKALQLILTQMVHAPHENLIKAVLTLRNLSQRTIARKHKIPPSDLSMVIKGQRKTPWIRRALADELGVPVHILFESLDWKNRTQK